MNYMIKQAKEVKFKPNFILVLLIGLTMFIVGSIPMSFMSLGVDKDISLPINDLILGFGFVTLTCFLYVKLIEKRSIRSLGFQKQNALKFYLKGLINGLVVFSFIVILGVMTGALTFEFTFKSIQWHVFLLLFLGFVIQGGTEEIVFRGWMFPILSAKYNVAVSIAITSFGFALLHGLNPGISIMGVVNLILFGIFSALYTLKEDSLWGICGFHSIWNWIQGSFYGIKVSGMTIPGGSLFTTDSVPNKSLLSGGAFGLEASILTSIVLTSASIYSYKKIKEKAC